MPIQQKSKLKKDGFFAHNKILLWREEAEQQRQYINFENEFGQKNQSFLGFDFCDIYSTKWVEL